MNRRSLIQSLKQEGYSSFIINAFIKVKREDFIPQNLKERAYINTALPTLDGQTISQPSCIALMLNMLDLEKIKNKHSIKILEIGSGTGYVLALLNSILPKADIYGLEINASLAELSHNLLKSNKKIKIINQSGTMGFKEQAPYDRILISASAKSKDIILNLASQLKEGGIIISPAGYDLIKIKRAKSSIIKEELKNAVMFVPLVD